ncbi:MAG: helix-hairpin-helix domain-containing protein [bacterium]
MKIVLPSLMLCILILVNCSLGSELLDLNSATLEQIQTLPLSAEQAQALWERLYFQGPLKSLYDLYDLPGFDVETVTRISSLVRVEPPPKGDIRAERMNLLYRQITELGADEGSGSAWSDDWVDRMMDPLDVNRASAEELSNLENLSPVDAVAIYQQVQSQDGLKNVRDLRAVPGLTRWGYYNARDYLVYEEPKELKGLHGSYQFRAYNTPYFQEEEEIIPFDPSQNPQPDLTHKLRLNWGRKWKLGLSYHRNFGEKDFYYNPNADFKVPQFKGYLGLHNQNMGAFKLERVYLGNYHISIGQGLVVETGDYFTARYSGYDFAKRPGGIVGDLSRTQEFGFRGAAAQVSWNCLAAVGFLSMDDKDAVINPDGSFSYLMLMAPRIDVDLYPSALLDVNDPNSWVDPYPGIQSPIDAVKELAAGANLQYRFAPGSHVGLTYFETQYDRELKPDIYALVDSAEYDEINDDYTNAEIMNSYSSLAESSIWSAAKSLRRIYGLEGRWVVGNLCFQGEVAELEVDGSPLKFGDDPKAATVSGFAQWNSVNLLALYRHYDVEYDNPYNRGFSNYSRYKGTILEDYYYLNNPVLGSLYTNAVTPQAEDGVFVKSRIQWSRQITTQFELDNWTRLADGQDYHRWVIKLYYRPIYPLQFNLRQKFQARAALNSFDKLFYDSRESRFTVRLRLSRYDQVEVLYSASYTKWPPRPRFTGDTYPSGQFTSIGNAANHAEALGISFLHHFNSNLEFHAFWGVYQGFLWTFEDTDFIVLDGEATRAWFSIASRLSDKLSVRFKYTFEDNIPITNVAARDGNEFPSQPASQPTEAWNVTEHNDSFRIQLDYYF